MIYARITRASLFRASGTVIRGGQEYACGILEFHSPHACAASGIAARLSECGPSGLVGRGARPARNEAHRLPASASPAAHCRAGGPSGIPVTSRLDHARR